MNPFSQPTDLHHTGVGAGGPAAPERASRQTTSSPRASGCDGDDRGANAHPRQPPARHRTRSGAPQRRRRHGGGGGTDGGAPGGDGAAGTRQRRCGFGVCSHCGPHLRKHGLQGGLSVPATQTLAARPGLWLRSTELRTTRARQDFLDNWLAHVKRLGWTNVLVGAIDDSIQAHCEAAGLPSLAMNSTSSLSAELSVEVCAVQ